VENYVHPQNCAFLGIMRELKSKLLIHGWTWGKTLNSFSGVNNLQAIHNVMVKCKNLMGQRDVALPVMSEVYTVPAATS
jgi:hypothetical protein